MLWRCEEWPQSEKNGAHLALFAGCCTFVTSNNFDIADAEGQILVTRA